MLPRSTFPRLVSGLAFAEDNIVSATVPVPAYLDAHRRTVPRNCSQSRVVSGGTEVSLRAVYSHSENSLYPALRRRGKQILRALRYIAGGKGTAQGGERCNPGYLDAEYIGSRKNPRRRRRAREKYPGKFNVLSLGCREGGVYVWRGGGVSDRVRRTARKLSGKNALGKKRVALALRPNIGYAFIRARVIFYVLMSKNKSASMPPHKYIYVCSQGSILASEY